jgi:hypothetical protein
MFTWLPAWVPSWLPTVVLLALSNAFMTFAWYYHVKQKTWPLLTAILISWLIALPEYILQVPANRYGHASRGGPFTLSQLKVAQEAITLVVFTLFAVFIAREKPRWNEYVAFVLIFAAVAVAMSGRRP